MLQLTIYNFRKTVSKVRLIKGLSNVILQDAKYFQRTIGYFTNNIN